MSEKHGVIEQLDQLIQHSYYAEDFELTASFKALLSRLDEEGQEVLTTEVQRRLRANPTLVELQFCTCFRIPGAVPFLVELLDSLEDANQTSRVIIQILSDYQHAEAYRSVSRFLDSSQHAEALTALTQIDFSQAVTPLRRALAKEGLYTTCIHILKHRFEAVGNDVFMKELTVIGDVPLARKRLEALFTRTQGEHNPFAEQVTSAILEWARSPEQ